MSLYIGLQLPCDEDFVAMSNEFKTAAFLDYGDCRREVGITRYASHKHDILKLSFGKLVSNIIPSAQIAHYRGERLLLEHKPSVSPACDDRGVDHLHFHLWIVAVEHCLMARRQHNLPGMEIAACERYRPLLKSGIDYGVVGIGTDIERSAVDADSLFGGLDIEGARRIVLHNKISLACHLDAAFARTEYLGITQSGLGIEPHFGAVLKHHLEFSSARHIQAQFRDTVDRTVMRQEYPIANLRSVLRTECDS